MSSCRSDRFFGVLTAKKKNDIFENGIEYEYSNMGKRDEKGREKFLHEARKISEDSAGLIHP